MSVSWRIWFAVLFLLVAGSAGAADQKTVHVYNWSDYITEDTLAKFEQATGINVVYDVYDSNEMLEAKLLAGGSGYDVVFPSAQPFAARHVAAGVYRALDRSKLPNYKHLDGDVLKQLASADPDARHLIPYMWGTTGIGYNVAKVQAALGESAPANSWRLIFDPTIAAKLAGCGITLLDDAQEAFAAALIYLGKDPNSTAKADIDTAQQLLKTLRPHIKYYHSSQYINDLANGDICVAHGYSGDVIQAQERAEEAGNNVQIAYTIPEEGAIMWIDTMAIPKDAPHPDQAHAFIDFLLTPQIIAEITDYVAYANGNAAATTLISEEIRTDTSIYPSHDIMARLSAPQLTPDAVQRQRTRSWTRIKSGQ